MPHLQGGSGQFQLEGIKRVTSQRDRYPRPTHPTQARLYLGTVRRAQRLFGSPSDDTRDNGDQDSQDDHLGASVVKAVYLKCDDLDLIFSEVRLVLTDKQMTRIKTGGDSFTSDSVPGNLR